MVSDCEDIDQDGYDTCSSGEVGDDGLSVDCNDADASVNPGASEVCNGIDDDCDGVVDEGDGNCGAGTVCLLGSCVEDCVDSDGDGYDTCNPGDSADDDGNAEDCNDNNAGVNPGASEVCNGVDDDCDGVVDEGDGNCGAGTVCLLGSCVEDCVDSDGDGYDTCNPGDSADDDGNAEDCNDNNAGVSPGASEVCNGVDDDCDGYIDEDNVCVTECNDGNDNDNDDLLDAQDPGCWDDIDNSLTYNPELDDENRAGIACSHDSDCGNDAWSGNAQCGGDGNVYQTFLDFTCLNPGIGSSTCQLIANSQLKQTCQFGCLSGACLISNCLDVDGDNYDTCSSGDIGDDGLAEDCDDSDVSVNPGAVEICNGVDDDCDGVVDEDVCEICDNGLDDDGDGLIDGLIELDEDNNETGVFGKQGSTGNIIDAVRNSSSLKLTCPKGGNPFLRSTTAGWEEPRSDLHQTADKVCNLLGYREGKSSYCSSGGKCNFHSPEDNCLWYWDGSEWKYTNAGGLYKYRNSWITELTCEGRLPACNNGVDDDGDGLIDYCDGTNAGTCDTGCASVNDNSEIPHDPDC